MTIFLPKLLKTIFLCVIVEVSLLSFSMQIVMCVMFDDWIISEYNQTYQHLRLVIIV